MHSPSTELTTLFLSKLKYKILSQDVLVQSVQSIIRRLYLSSLHLLLVELLIFLKGFASFVIGLVASLVSIDIPAERLVVFLL